MLASLLCCSTKDASKHADVNGLGCDRTHATSELHARAREKRVVPGRDAGWTGRSKPSPAHLLELLDPLRAHLERALRLCVDLIALSVTQSTDLLRAQHRATA